jgi:hypothetical protein
VLNGPDTERERYEAEKKAGAGVDRECADEGKCGGGDVEGTAVPSEIPKHPGRKIHPCADTNRLCSHCWKVKVSLFSIG